MRYICWIFLIGYVVFAGCESRSVIVENTGSGGGSEGTEYITFLFSGVPVTSGTTENRNPSLSPSNDVVVYQSSVEPSRYNIFASNVAYLSQNNLSNSLENDIQPVFSPNGYSIAFYRNNEVYIMDNDGRNQRKISRTPIDTQDPIHFSRDGRYIIITSIDADVHNVSRIAIDGTAQEILTQGLGGYNAQVSPLTGKIVFVSGEVSRQDIYTMYNDGTDIKKVTNIWGTYVDPIFSPDERSIAFSKQILNFGYYNIFEITIDGDTLRQLTNTLSVDATPVFTPDGRWIAFNRRVDNTWDICFISRDRQYEVNFTNAPFTWELFPVFSTVGLTMYFESNYNGFFHIWSASLAPLYALRKDASFQISPAGIKGENKVWK